MTIKEMRATLGMTQQMFSEKFNIPKRTIENWESGKSKPPKYVEEMIEQSIVMKECHVPESCLRYHIDADIYLSPSMMDVMYERGIILKERDVTADVVKTELEKYIGAFAEVEKINVNEIWELKYKPEEYEGVTVEEAMEGCPELAKKLEDGEISSIELRVAYKKMKEGGEYGSN